MNLIKKLINKETVLYIIFGVLTTALNYFVFWLLLKLLGENTWYTPLIANTVAFIAGVIFAFVTNKLFVFESKSWHNNIIKKEVIPFVLARLFSYGFEQLGLLIVGLTAFATMSFMFFNWQITGILIAKLVLNVIVVLMNYFFSKLVIFKNKDEKVSQTNEQN